jgi:histidine ammonia-lyase
LTSLIREASRAVAIGSRDVSLDEVLAIARGEVQITLDPGPAFRARIAASQRAVRDHLERGDPVYGVTTGVGASVSNEIASEHQEALPHNILRFHGCGTGRLLGETEAAAVVAVRLISLAKGHSGVRWELLERLCDLLNHRLLPRIPEEGSVGASGDLTPLSYLAALLVGEREATLAGRETTAAGAHAELGIEPLRLAPKESLALMNGTTVMTALGCLALERARRAARAAAAVTAILSQATRGNPTHFDARIFDWKPHPGSTRCAAWIRDDLRSDGRGDPPPPARLQDRYSLRCAPHVVGVLLDAVDISSRVLEIEVNGADDNPLVDPERGDVLHGGNFYGGHVAFVMDSLKAAVASVADLLDRQLCLLCVPETSGGLPANLVAGNGSDAATHHGFKAMQISTSALAAEALKLTMPAAAFSRSTESHNQDKVSMGTIAARDALRVLELTETIVAILVLAACQAVDLRGDEITSARARALHGTVRKAVPMLRADRRQDVDIEAVLESYRSGDLALGDCDDPEGAGHPHS